jgi:hypothetical protein
MADAPRSSSRKRTGTTAAAAAVDGTRNRVFERGPALEADALFKKDFSTEAAYAKAAIAPTLAPFASHSSAAVARTRYPLVLVRVVDNAAIPVPDARLELYDDQGEFLDAVASDSIGLGLLRFPAELLDAAAPGLDGTVRVDGTQDIAVRVPADEDFVVVHVTRTGATSGAGSDGASRHDSVIPRLPAFFSIGAADEVVRHRVTADGPDPCFAAAMGRQCTYRAPRVRWIYARRIAYQGLRPPRKLYVRVRQEWHFVGHSFGQPERVDSRDVASIVGSLDATLAAQLVASGRLDASTDSVLGIDASGRLRAQASLDGELDASVGLHLFEGGLGNPLSVSGAADVSIDTSLLVSAQLKLRASLRNQLHATASLAGRASVGLNADASISVNPSLSRELNIPRFVIHENYVVSSFLEDVQEIQEVRLFEDLKDKTLFKTPLLPNFPFPFPPPPLFPPADIVEYRPIFERQLLEPALAGRFRTLRTALDNAAGRGPLVHRVRFEVLYSATCKGSFRAQVLGRTATVNLVPERSQAVVAIDLPGGQFLDVLNQELVDFSVSLNPIEILSGGGTVRITGITIFSDASTRGQRLTNLPAPFEATLNQFVATFDGINLALPSADSGILNDPLVVHINRNPTYYMGLLVKAALANPSLRFDVPQLQRIGPESVLWRLPIHGFAGNKALVLVPAVGPDVDAILDDLGRSTVVQLAVNGNWSEAMQGENALADLLGQLFPVVEGLELPLALLEGLTSGAGLVPAIVDAGATAAGLGSAAGAVPGVSGGVLTTVAGVLDV